MQAFDSVKRGLDRAMTVVCVALFAILVAVVTWQVFTRQILNSPSQWSESLSRYLFVWVGLFGAALVFGERGHLAIDVGVRQLPQKIQKWIAVLVQAIIIAFSAYLLVWGGWRAAMNAWQQNLSGLPTTVGPWYLAMPIAGIVIIVYSVYHLLNVIIERDTPFGGEDLEAVEVLETHAAEVLDPGAELDPDVPENFQDDPSGQTSKPDSDDKDKE